MVVMGSDLGFMSLVLGVVGSLVGLGGCDFFGPLLFDLYWVLVQGQLGVGLRSIGIWDDVWMGEVRLCGRQVEAIQRFGHRASEFTLDKVISLYTGPPVTPTSVEWGTLYKNLYCIVLCCVVLYCIVLYCIVLYCIVLYCIVLYCIVLYCIVLYCIVLYCTLLYYIVLYCIVLYCIVLYCIVLYCIVLYCIVLYCIVLYCIVLYCIVLFIQ